MKFSGKWKKMEKNYAEIIWSQRNKCHIFSLFLYVGANFESLIWCVEFRVVTELRKLEKDY